MRVLFTKWLISGWLLLGMAGAVSAQVSLTLNLGGLDNRSARCWEDGKPDTTSFSTLSPQDISVGEDSELWLEINPGNRLVATVRLTFVGGELSAVEWQDGDGSEQAELVALSPERYSMNRDGVFRLNGLEVSLSLSGTDLSYIYIPELWTTNYSGSLSARLFPGDYRFALGDAQNGKGVCDLLFDLNENGNWESSPQWRAAHTYGSQSPAWKNLAATWYSASGSSLNLNGQTAQLALNVNNTDLFLAGYFGSNIDAKTSVRLFPGNIDLQVGMGDGKAATLNGLFDPDASEIASVLYWYDSDSSQSDTNNVLPNSYFAHTNDTIFIQGDTAWLDLTASDNSVSVPGFVHEGPGYAAQVLLPGDYQLLVGGTKTRIGLEMIAGAGLNTEVIVEDGETADNLNCDYFMTGTES